MSNRSDAALLKRQLQTRLDKLIAIQADGEENQHEIDFWDVMEIAIGELEWVLALIDNPNAQRQDFRGWDYSAYNED